MITPRRVIIGLDREGRSTVTSDRPAGASFDAGYIAMHQIWLTTETPAELTHDVLEESPPEAPIHQPPAGGTLFQICTFKAHTESAMHKTDTLDYVVAMSGTIDIDTSDGQTVTLHEGDCLVQLETEHRWANRSDEPCTIAVVCVSTSTDSAADLSIKIS